MIATVEPDTITGVDLDLPVVCESRDRRWCQGEAVLVLHLACGCHLLACTPCRDRSRRLWDGTRGYRCMKCRTSLFGDWPEVVVREVPL